MKILAGPTRLFCPEKTNYDIAVDLSKRRFLIGGGVAGLSLLATACPFDGVTRDKAVRYTDIAIGYLKDILPIVQGIGGTAVADLVSKAIPALEKVKAALEKSDFPAAGNFFDTVTSILGQTATALLQLPASSGRMLVIGLLGLAQATLRTVGLFVEKQMPSAAAVATLPKAVRAAADESALMKMFEATRF